MWLTLPQAVGITPYPVDFAIKENLMLLTRSGTGIERIAEHLPYRRIEANVTGMLATTQLVALQSAATWLLIWSETQTYGSRLHGKRPVQLRTLYGPHKHRIRHQSNMQN
ncbi:Hypothetical protein POVN_LOCUS38 [uncultured virus]|nr:Hypothetical protein POVN_LOCUS38 [uncultured virus]